MKFLITISSCHRDVDFGYHDAIRDTWGKVADENHVPYVITMGRKEGAEYEAHERSIDVVDDWQHLPDKTLSNCQYALERGYDWMFQGFSDTYISIPRLLAAWKEVQNDKHPVRGNFYYHNVWEGHPCGGSGYWMRSDFMNTLVEYGMRGEPSEDRAIGILMQEKDIIGFHDSRYDHCSMRGGVSLHNSNITNHLWTHYNEYFQNALGIKDYHWKADWLHQEQRKELTGQWTEQDEIYMRQIPQLKKFYRFL